MSFSPVFLYQPRVSQADTVHTIHRDTLDINQCEAYCYWRMQIRSLHANPEKTSSMGSK